MRRSNDVSTPRASRAASRACTVLRERPVRSARARTVARGLSASASSSRASVASMASGLCTVPAPSVRHPGASEHLAQSPGRRLRRSRAGAPIRMHHGTRRIAMTTVAGQPDTAAPPLEVLREIEQRVLWLATSIVHHANRVRPNPSGLKVGGHQASSASMVTIMTVLWFNHLRAQDRVSVKPHASPVLHALNYLLGELDERYLTTLRAFAGLQAYPSRSKDPDPVDYSTGSVG